MLSTVLTSQKIDALLGLGLSAEELAVASASTTASIYARRKDDPTRRGELDKKIDHLYFVAREMLDYGLDGPLIGGWLASCSPHLNGDTPLERLGRGQFKRVRTASLAWMRGEPATLSQAPVAGDEGVATVHPITQVAG
jgi:hypothetical protein